MPLTLAFYLLLLQTEFAMPSTKLPPKLSNYVVSIFYANCLFYFVWEIKAYTDSPEILDTIFTNAIVDILAGNEANFSSINYNDQSTTYLQ